MLEPTEASASSTRTRGWTRRDRDAHRRTRETPRLSPTRTTSRTPWRRDEWPRGRGGGEPARVLPSITPLASWQRTTDSARRAAVMFRRALLAACGAWASRRPRRSHQHSLPAHDGRHVEGFFQDHAHLGPQASLPSVRLPSRRRRSSPSSPRASDRARGVDSPRHLVPIAHVVSSSFRPAG